MKALGRLAVFALLFAGPAAHAQEITISGPLYVEHEPDAAREAREYGVGEAELYARYLQATAPRPAPTPIGGLGEVALSGRFVYGDRIGFAGGADLAAGASNRGVAGDAVLYPVGLGAAVGATGFGAVFAGVGAGGWGDAAAGLELPIDGRITFDVGTRIRLSFDARLAWVPGVAARHDGAPHLPFCDEALFGVTTRIGHLWEHRRGRDAGGYFFRLEHAEMLGESFLGLSIGYQMSGSG
jgi:hypothetical protein